MAAQVGEERPREGVVSLSKQFLCQMIQTVGAYGPRSCGAQGYVTGAMTLLGEWLIFVLVLLLPVGHNDDANLVGGVFDEKDPQWQSKRHAHVRNPRHRTVLRPPSVRCFSTSRPTPNGPTPGA